MTEQLNRPIKFRGKRIDNGRWVYGQHFKTPLTDENSGTTPDKGWFFLCGETRHCIVQDCVSFVIDIQTLGQYTGLSDRNGNEIYEGDILDGSWINPMTSELVKKFYEVSYERGRYLAKLIGHHPYGTTMLYFENEKSEVIGTIHENPELLEESR